MYVIVFQDKHILTNCLNSIGFSLVCTSRERIFHFGRVCLSWKTITYIRAERTRPLRQNISSQYRHTYQQRESHSHIIYNNMYYYFQCKLKCSGGSVGRKGRAPPSGPKFLHFHAVFGKNGQIVCWRSPSGVGAPPLGNPGSATEMCKIYTAFQISLANVQCQIAEVYCPVVSWPIILEARLKVIVLPALHPCTETCRTVP